MAAQARLSESEAILPLRTRFRQEANGQIVHDSIHRREGWTKSYLLEWSGQVAGFGSIAIAGPWKDKPTVFEFYLLPEHRLRAFALFECFLQESGARFFEAQSSDGLFTAMAITYGRNVESEKIVFHDGITTFLLAPGARLRQITPLAEIQLALARRQGGGEWTLELADTCVAKGGVLFHYNAPYGDIYMEVSEGFRRRGFGAFLVQELKRICYELGAIPAARCNVGNAPSRRTLQKAGFVPNAHILIGSIAFPGAAEGIAS